MVDRISQGYRRRTILITVVVVAVIVLVTVAVRLTRPDQHGSSPTAVQSTPVPAEADAPWTGHTHGTTLKKLTSTSDAETFARSVAHALFDWDTVTPVDLSGYTGRLVAVADPTGESSPGLVNDIKAYLPSPDAWAMLRQYWTRQWIEVSSIQEPSLWPQAVEEAGPEGLLPGTTAFTISGTRHRAGVWERESVSSRHDVAFTVFVVCEPSYPTCHLLRLSRLNNPMR